jgi:hypothetical protein
LLNEHYVDLSATGSLQYFLAGANDKRQGMRSLFPSSYDRTDVLMSAACRAFVSAPLISVIPRFGVLLLEILFGLFFIGCALIARKWLRRRTLGTDGSAKPKKNAAAGQEDIQLSSALR